MADDIALETRLRIEAGIIERAANDPRFRAQLIADPRQGLASHLGVRMPDQLSIRVDEEQPGEVVLVLPALSLPDELTDQELEAVAAGGYSDQCGSESRTLVPCRRCS